MVIEETFTLKCGADELEQFIDRSRQYATGWIGFYWGKTPNEISPGKNDSRSFHAELAGVVSEETPVRFLAMLFVSNGVTAHRGNSSDFPENTMPAFQSGIDVGAEWIELDIFRTEGRANWSSHS